MTQPAKPAVFGEDAKFNQLILPPLVNPTDVLLPGLQVQHQLVEGQCQFFQFVTGLYSNRAVFCMLFYLVNLGGKAMQRRQQA